MGWRLWGRTESDTTEATQQQQQDNVNFCFCTFYSLRIPNARLDEAQAGIKIARRNINNLKYADDTTLMAESEEELKSLLMKMKEESEKLA